MRGSNTDLLEIFDLLLEFFDAHGLELTGQQGTSTVVLYEYMLDEHLNKHLV
jgi:hypothetical protein